MAGAHARVKALPPDYQIVYKEIQKYFFKVGPVALNDGPLLPGIVDFFEEGVAAGKGVLELLGNDRVRLDFNYAYNPSCAFSHDYVCPLAPRENWLDVPIRAGEMI